MVNLLSDVEDLVWFAVADIPRTFPDNIFFQDVPSDPNAKRLPLYHVLIALAHKNQRVGYCQVRLGWRMNTTFFLIPRKHANIAQKIPRIALGGKRLGCNSVYFLTYCRSNFGL